MQAVPISFVSDRPEGEKSRGLLTQSLFSVRLDSVLKMFTTLVPEIIFSVSRLFITADAVICPILFFRQRASGARVDAHGFKF